MFDDISLGLIYYVQKQVVFLTKGNYYFFVLSEMCITIMCPKIQGVTSSRASPHPQMLTDSDLSQNKSQDLSESLNSSPSKSLEAAENGKIVIRVQNFLNFLN